MSDLSKAEKLQYFHDEIYQAAVNFLDVSFSRLTAEGVLPRTPYYAYLSVGRDYFGDSIHSLAEYEKLDSLLTKIYPNRFDEPLKRKDAEFASTYIFSFLSAAIASFGKRPFAEAQESGAARKLIQELFEVLDHIELEIVCCREVTHLTTVTGAPLVFGRFTIIPAQRNVGGPRLSDLANDYIPGAYGAYGRDRPFHFDPPSSMIVIRAKSSADPWTQGEILSREIDRFLLHLHLLHSATTQSIWQVFGTSTLVSRMQPHFVSYKERPSFAPLRRTTVLSEEDLQPIETIAELFAAVAVKRSGMVATSFDMAIHRFVRTYEKDDYFDQIVDLATALEALLTSNDLGNDAISLRLRNRASALLSTPRDSAESIFKDIGLLYSIRSLLVHGGSIKEKNLKKEIMKISTVPESDPFGTALARGVDRLRDLVRRSILARIALGDEKVALWSFETNTPVDQVLASDTGRNTWRNTWRSHLIEKGIGSYIDEAKTALDFISRDDQ